MSSIPSAAAAFKRIGCAVALLLVSLPNELVDAANPSNEPVIHKLPKDPIEALGTPVVQSKQSVVACNAFPDSRSAEIGVRPAQRPVPRNFIARKPKQRWLRLRTPPPGLAVEPTADAVWTRSIAYGNCEEYEIDLKSRQLFFMSPDGEAWCSLSQGALDAARISGNKHARLIAVMTKMQAASSHCTIQAFAAPFNITEEMGHQPEAEVVAVDAFVQAPPATENKDPEETKMDEEDRLRGLAPLAPLDKGGLIRLEDIVEDASITSEVVGSRTLGLGAVYSVDAKKLHVVLEDIRGSQLLDHQDLDFKRQQTYVAIRIGAGGDKAFPQKLLLYNCQDPEPSEDM